MEVEFKNPKIYLITGLARHGKDSIASLLTKFYEENNKKVIYSRAGKYIRYYVMEMTDWDGSEETKPRELLNQIGTDIIRNKLNKSEMLLQRQNDDLEIYSYFYDAIIVPDIRFPREIEAIKEKFNNVITINVLRLNFDSDLTLTEKNHIIENSLQDYDDYDYKIINTTLEKLASDVKEIYLKEEHQ